MAQRSPRWHESEMYSTNASNAAAASFLEIPACSAMALMTSPFPAIKRFLLLASKRTMMVCGSRDNLGERFRFVNGMIAHIFFLHRF